MQSLNLYEKVIKGMELCRYDPDPGMPLKSEVSCDICPYWDDTYGCRMNDMFDDAIALLKAQDAELGRLKNCRAECKIECLLDEYNKVVAERDALRKAQEPVAPEKKSFLCAGEYETTPLMNVCGACGEWLLSAAPRAKYCPNCGRAVKWE